MTKNWTGEGAVQLFSNIIRLELGEDIHAGDVRWKLLTKKHPNDYEYHTLIDHFKGMVSVCKSTSWPIH